MNTQDIFDGVDRLKLLGKPFRYGGRGPDVFDCYGLVRYLYRHIGQIELPDYRTPEGNASISALTGSQIASRWTSLPTPSVGMLYFKMPLQGSHVALSAGDGRFVHVWAGSGGVVVEHLVNWEKRLIGNYAYNG